MSAESRRPRLKSNASQQVMKIEANSRNVSPAESARSKISLEIKIPSARDASGKKPKTLMSVKAQVKHVDEPMSA